MTKVFDFQPGDSPLLVSMPHVGTCLSPEVERVLNDKGRKIMDTDWHLDQLYNFLAGMDVSCLMARYNRTVIDLNRDGEGGLLYPGQSETELCPLTSFDNEPLYRSGCVPDETEIRRRKEVYWQPYHDKIRTELDRIKERHGYALLWEAHSIQSHVPRFFEGQLPDLNLGNVDGTSCAPALAAGVLSVAAASPYRAVLNGRFKGGYITRHYGDPENNIHSLQLEISQITYMEEAPAFLFQEARAKKLRSVLQAMMTGFLTAPRHRK
ncbi:MAG: N-formylglutamate deformylase [Emcibacter sp.]|nr:N-formylglutamate deformylase [Emcibacter sp.]